MDWEAIGAMAEAFGAVGVIVTLIFLARQIQQNTRAIRASTNHDLTQARNDLNLRFGLDAQASDLLLRAARNLGELDLNERYRHMLLMRAVVGICEDTFIQYKEGMCDVEPWRSTQIVLRQIVSSETFESWWNRNREIFLQDFRKEVDEMCAASRRAAADEAQRTPEPRRVE